MRNISKRTKAQAQLTGGMDVIEWCSFSWVNPKSGGIDSEVPDQT